MRKIPLISLTWISKFYVLEFLLMIFWISACKAPVNVNDGDKKYQKLQAEYDSLLPAWISRFENDIIDFVKQDSIKGNPEYDVVFIGSSTFEQWKTMQEDFAPASTINRGFGGSTIREVIYYSDRILFPYKPKIVVLYVGNDVWGDPAEPTTEQLFDYFRLFEQKLHRQLPNTILNFVSMRPSPAKNGLVEKQTAINSLLQQFVNKTAKTNFIDIRPVMYNNSGRLRNDIFKSDSLHLNDTGNKLITDVIKPVLIEQLSELK
jgi:lysophospholipase L1-like esterase